MMLYLNEPGLELRKSRGTCLIVKDGNVRHKMPLEKLEGVVMFTGANIATPCLMGEKG